MDTLNTVQSCTTVQSSPGLRYCCCSRHAMYWLHRTITHHRAQAHNTTGPPHRHAASRSRALCAPPNRPTRPGPRSRAPRRGQPAQAPPIAGGGGHAVAASGNGGGPATASGRPATAEHKRGAPSPLHSSSLQLHSPSPTFFLAQMETLAGAEN